MPEASISADGSGMLARMPPAGWRKKMGAIVRPNTQLAPPSLELKTFSRNFAAEKPTNGTTTLPLGWTIG